MSKNNIIIEVDQEIIQDSVQAASAEAIKSACGGYDVRSAIEKSFTNSVLTDSLAEAVNRGVDAIDFQNIVDAVSRQMTRSIVAASTMMLREAALEVIFKIRGTGEYGAEAKAERDEIRAEFSTRFKKERKNYRENKIE